MYSKALKRHCNQEFGRTCSGATHLRGVQRCRQASFYPNFAAPSYSSATLLPWLACLQVVAGAAPQLRVTAQEAKVPLERNWDFSAASPGEQDAHSPAHVECPASIAGSPARSPLAAIFDTALQQACITIM